MIRTGCGSKLYHFGILSADKCRNHCSLCIDCRSVLGSNPEGIKTGCGQVQEYADRLRNECGFTKLDSASCPHLVRALVDVRFYKSSQCSLKHKLFSDLLVSYDRLDLQASAMHIYEKFTKKFYSFYLADYSKVSTFLLRHPGIQNTNFFPYNLFAFTFSICIFQFKCLSIFKPTKDTPSTSFITIFAISISPIEYSLICAFL